MEAAKTALWWWPRHASISAFLVFLGGGQAIVLQWATLVETSMLWHKPPQHRIQRDSIPWPAATIPPLVQYYGITCSAAAETGTSVNMGQCVCIYTYAVLNTRRGLNRVWLCAWASRYVAACSSQEWLSWPEVSVQADSDSFHIEMIQTAVISWWPSSLLGPPILTKQHNISLLPII